MHARRAGLAAHPDVLVLASLLLLAGILRAGLLFRAPPFITNDSLSYLLPGWQLAHAEPLDVAFKRPPAYPGFIGAALWLFGAQDLSGLLAIQHLVGVATVGLAFALGRLAQGRAAGAVAGGVVALSGPLMVTEHYVMSETLFGLLITAAHLALVYGLARRHRGVLVAAGLLLGLSALARPVAQMVVPLGMGAILLVLPRWRPALTATAGLGLAYVLAVAPWIVRNGVVQGSYTIAGGLGEGLAVRTIRLDQEFDFRTPPGEDRLRQERRIYREEAREGSAYDLARRLREEAGVTPAEADRAMRDIALGAIAQKPLYYVGGSLDMFGRMLVGRPIRLRQDWQPWRGTRWDERVQHLFPAGTPAEERQFEQAQAIVTLFDPAHWAPVLGVGLAAGLAWAMGGRRWGVLLIAASSLGMLFASAFLVGIEWRYRYPLDPTLYAIVGCGLVWLGRLAGVALSRLPASRVTG